MKKGKFLVIEGTDGSGKGTQLKLLEEKLKLLKIPFETIDFPRYEENVYGELIGQYLQGDLGSKEDVNPYLISLAYAGDRLLAKPKIEKWLKEGKLVIANRYTTSNKAYMSAQMFEKSRRRYLDWLDKLEYQTNGLPKEDMVILLYLDPLTSYKNVGSKSKRSYLKNKSYDIHEQDLKYQHKVALNYLQLAKEEGNWEIINCLEGKVMKPPETIHQELVELLKTKRIIRG